MKKMTLPAAVLIAAAAIITGCAGNVNERLNSRASEEYLEPVRPGYEGRNPFWNGFATKFIYAPAFGFPEVEGAARYRFTVEYLGTEMVQSPRYRAATGPTSLSRTRSRGGFSARESLTGGAGHSRLRSRPPASLRSGMTFL